MRKTLRTSGKVWLPVIWFIYGLQALFVAPWLIGSVQRREESFCIVLAVQKQFDRFGLSDATLCAYIY